MRRSRESREYAGPRPHLRLLPAPLPRLLPAPLPALLFIAAFVLSSCDAVAPSEGLVLQEKTVSFRFEIDTDGVSAGESIEVDSEASADLEQALDADGYSKGDVLSATVTRVELERVNPTTVDLSILDEASVALRASGGSARTVASSSSLPAARTASLSIGGNDDATSFVVAPSFRGSLTIVPITVPQGVLVLRATVAFRIEVEGV